MSDCLRAVDDWRKNGNLKQNKIEDIYLTTKCGNCLMHGDIESNTETISDIHILNCQKNNISFPEINLLGYRPACQISWLFILTVHMHCHVSLLSSAADACEWSNRCRCDAAWCVHMRLRWCASAPLFAPSCSKAHTKSRPPSSSGRTVEDVVARATTLKVCKPKSCDGAQRKLFANSGCQADMWQRSGCSEECSEQLKCIKRRVKGVGWWVAHNELRISTYTHTNLWMSDCLRAVDAWRKSRSIQT